MALLYETGYYRYSVPGWSRNILKGDHQLLNLNQPSVVLREAWSITPLDTIREAVFQSIAELERLVHAENEGQAELGADPTGTTARRMALQLCTLELMTEVGLESSTDPVPPEAKDPGPDWGRQYFEAIERYRLRAATSIGEALGIVPRIPDDRA